MFAPVVVVGAGLAGLACAQRLCRAGVDVVIVEASNAVGGRVRTDVIDGFRCDRGFQLLNPAYPVLERVVDIASLDLRPFGAGVVVANDSARWALADPRRHPARLVSTLRAPLGSTVEKLRFARWAARSLQPVPTLLARADRTLAAEFDAAGITGSLRRGVVEPFLAGVLAEEDGSTSANFVALLIRSFVLGTPAVPSLGMGRLSEALAATLPVGTVRLNIPVTAVNPRTVRTAEEEIVAAAVVVATDPSAAARLTGRSATPMKALTTFWYASAEPPSHEPFLHLDADRRGPVINAAVMTNACTQLRARGPQPRRCHHPRSRRFVRRGAGRPSAGRFDVRRRRRRSGLGARDDPCHRRSAAGPAAAVGGPPTDRQAGRPLRRRGSPGHRLDPGRFGVWASSGDRRVATAVDPAGWLAVRGRTAGAGCR